MTSVSSFRDISGGPRPTHSYSTPHHESAGLEGRSPSLVDPSRLTYLQLFRLLSSLSNLFYCCAAMVRAQDYAGVAAKSKKQAAGKKKRTETGAGEGSAPPMGSDPSSKLPNPSPIEDRPVATASLAIIAAPTGRTDGGEEEREEVVPPLKRRRLVRIADLQPRPSDQADKGKGKKGAGKKNQGKTADKWESTISLEKDASVAELGVSLKIAEKVITPADEEFMETFGDMELAPRLVRASMRGVTMAYEAYRRIERLDAINRSQSQEILNFTERVKTLGNEMLELREERDLLRGQLSSLEEEKKSWEVARKILQAQIATGEEERLRLAAEKDRLAGGFKKEMMEVQERSRKYLLDCQAAVEGKLRVEDMLKELRGSIGRERIEAIKRWKRRNLNAECLELACDVTLSSLKKCYELHFPAGSDGPSFEEYAEPLLPALGLSLEEMREMVEGERPVIPDEELDRSSEEEEEGISPLPSPPSTSVGFSLRPADPSVDPSPSP